MFSHSILLLDKVTFFDMEDVRQALLGFVTVSTLHDGIVLASVHLQLRRLSSTGKKKKFAALAAGAVPSKRRHRPGEEIHL